jgi:hypothetical protein
MKFLFWKPVKTNQFGIASIALLDAINERVFVLQNYENNNWSHFGFVNELRYKHPTCFTQNNLYIELIQYFTEIQFISRVKTIKYHFSLVNTSKRYLFSTFDFAGEAIILSKHIPDILVYVNCQNPSDNFDCSDIIQHYKSLMTIYDEVVTMLWVEIGLLLREASNLAYIHNTELFGGKNQQTIMLIAELAEHITPNRIRNIVLAICNKSNVSDKIELQDVDERIAKIQYLHFINTRIKIQDNFGQLEFIFNEMRTIQTCSAKNQKSMEEMGYELAYIPIISDSQERKDSQDFIKTIYNAIE